MMRKFGIWEGISLVGDVVETAREKRYMRRSVAGKLQTPTFSCTGRVTVMPVFSASGVFGPSLSIFRKAHLPLRQVAVDGEVETQTLSTFPSHNAMILMAKIAPGVTLDSFYQWAVRLTNFVSHLTSGSRMILSTYDAYRSHISLRVLKHFRNHGLIVYALMSHNSGTQPPCEAVIFRLLKHEVNKSIGKVGYAFSKPRLDVFKFCAVSKRAYRRSIT